MINFNLKKNLEKNKNQFQLKKNGALQMKNKIFSLLNNDILFLKGEYDNLKKQTTMLIQYSWDEIKKNIEINVLNKFKQKYLEMQEDFAMK